MSVVFAAELIEKVGEPSNESATVAFFDVNELHGSKFPADMPVFEALASRQTGPFID